MERASKVGLQRARVLAAPSIRRLAREFGVDIGEVSGSGTRGRVIADEVKAHARRILTRARQATATPVESEPDLPDFSQWGVVERTRMSSVRRATARQMSRAWQAVPHVTEFEAVRRKLKTRRPSLPLSVTAYTVKVLGAALETFPQFNASLDVGAKSLSEISLEIASVAEKARARTITLEELQGGTFTVTNLSGLGGTLFTPIINHPEVAILGLFRSTFEPVLTGGISGSFQPRLMMRSRCRMTIASSTGPTRFAFYVGSRSGSSTRCFSTYPKPAFAEVDGGALARAFVVEKEALWHVARYDLREVDGFGDMKINGYAS